LGRVAAASIGLCFLGGMAAPADAGHRHHTEAGKSEARKSEPPKQPSGPLLLAVSIGSQKVTVYDNGAPVVTSSVSTGVPGHPTPTGIFSVIQKQRWHHSNLYSNAPMPYMQRITWSGVALHAGVVPGHPASHGCIRLPAGFAVRLWGMTKVGVRVIVTRGDAGPPYEIEHPHLAELAKKPEDARPEEAKPEAPKSEGSGKPEGAAVSSSAVVVATTDAVTSDSGSEHGAPPSPPAAGSPDNADPAAPPAQKAEPAPPPKGEDVLQRPGQLSLFISRREGKLFVRKGFTPAFDVPITIAQPEKPLGTHLFTASRATNEGMRWLAVSFSDRAATSSGASHGGSSHGKRKGRAERERPAPVTADSLHRLALEALDRIELPADALARLIPLVSAGTSLVISDQGLGGETGKDTDFIVVTK
jgi:hypothetical protein